MKIGWSSNFYRQPTGYGRVGWNIMTRLQNETDHEVVHHCMSGLQRSQPFTDPETGVKIYSKTSQGGKWGTGDLKAITELEGIDIWVLNYDVHQSNIHKLDVDYVLYPPVDHDPLPPVWFPSMKSARDIVPYSDFGKRVIEEAIGDRYVSDPIRHGVDVDKFHPVEASKEKVFGVDEDTFVAAIWKNNVGSRWKPVRHLRAFAQFHSEVPDSVLYLHTSNKQHNHAYDLDRIISQLGIGDAVYTANETKYRFGYEDEELNRLYSTADLTLNVTAGEGYGLPIAESMAAGTPVVAGGFSTMPELLGAEEGEVKNKPFIDTEIGWLVATHDEEPTPGKHGWRRTFAREDMVEAMLDAYNSDLEERGKIARDHIFTETWESKAQEWADYFDELETEMNQYEEGKQAILALGPESSGTRLVTEILTEMGFEGNNKHHQPWDDELPKNQDKIVWRRSYPHDNKWPDLHNMTERLRRRNYTVAAVVMERDMHATVDSQLDHNHVDKPFQAVRQIKEGKRRIINDLQDARVDYVPVSYENLVARPEKAVQTLAEQLGIEFDGDLNIEITDENEKHY